MHPERAFRVINLLDIPEGKRKFWPQKSAIVVRQSDREIVDVIQYFSSAAKEADVYINLYPGCRMFFNSVGDFKDVSGLMEKIDWCFRPIDRNTYVVGEVTSDVDAARNAQQ